MGIGRATLKHPAYRESRKDGNGVKVLMVTLLCAFGLLGGVASAANPANPASPEASSSPAPVAALNPAMLARAQSWLGMLQSGKPDRSQLDDQMNTLLTPTAVAGLADKIAPFGPATSFTQARIVQDGPNTAYIYAVTFKNGTKVMMIFALDTASGKISGLRLTPAE